MDDYTALIQRFYRAFANADAEIMVSCYHDDIRFEDPAFGELYGEQAKNMWRMLVRPGIKITYSDVAANENPGSANWIAEYHFGKSKRAVMNRIHAEFEFRDGKIIRHTDHFDLWKWARQALGLAGILLGWTPWMKHRIRTSTKTKLSEFQRK